MCVMLEGGWGKRDISGKGRRCVRILSDVVVLVAVVLVVLVVMVEECFSSFDQCCRRGAR